MEFDVQGRGVSLGNIGPDGKQQVTIFGFLLTNAFLWPCLVLYISIYFEANTGLPKQDRIPFFGFLSGFQIFSAHKEKFPNSWKRTGLFVCWAGTGATVFASLIYFLIAAFRA